MKMTKELLEQLGSCGDYVRTFIRTFPTTDERFKDGVEVTADVCAEHNDKFSWSWAAENMLTNDAYVVWSERVESGPELQALVARRDEVYRVFNDAIAKWRAENEHYYGEPNELTSDEGRRVYDELSSNSTRDANQITIEIGKFSARTFGELFEDPTNHSERLTQALERVEELRVDRDRRQLRTLRGQVKKLTTDREYWTDEPKRQLTRIAAELAEAETQLRDVEARNRQHDVTLARVRLEAAERTLVTAQENLKNALESERTSTVDDVKVDA